MAALHTGAFVLSLDLDRSVTHGNPLLRGPSSPIGAKLLAMIAARGMEATWAVYDPSRSAWVEAIQAIGTTQEVAVLADDRWIVDKRAEFAAGLVAVVAKARSAGLVPTTLAWRTAASPAHLDLLVKQGITAVRSLVDNSNSPGTGGWKGLWQRGSTDRDDVLALRWGLWQIAGKSDLLSSGFKEVRRTIDRATHERGIVHLVIDVASVGSRELEVLDQVLAHVEDHCAKDQLSNGTLSALAQQLTYPRQSVPAGSILRRSAA